MHTRAIARAVYDYDNDNNNDDDDDDYDDDYDDDDDSSVNNSNNNNILLTVTEHFTIMVSYSAVVLQKSSAAHLYLEISMHEHVAGRSSVRHRLNNII